MQTFDFTGTRILVVEDDSTNFLFLKILLNRANADIIWAKSGAEALELMHQNTDIKVILLDIQLPDMCGVDVAKTIKKEFPDKKIIVQTAFAMSGEREKILEAGCDEYVSKPIDSKRLLSLIEQYR